MCDVRDAAQAHLAAATSPAAAGRRYVVSCEARVPAADLAAALRLRLRAGGDAECEARAARVHTDESWGGGAVAIGAREVASEEALWRDLGVRCWPTEETLADMADALVKLKRGYVGGVASRNISVHPCPGS